VIKKQLKRLLVQQALPAKVVMMTLRKSNHLEMK